MENAYDALRTALAQTRQINAAADSSANTMAELLEGRLRHVSSYRLAKLKRELRDFNIHTKTWKK